MVHMLLFLLILFRTFKKWISLFCALMHMYFYKHDFDSIFYAIMFILWQGHGHFWGNGDKSEPHVKIFQTKFMQYWAAKIRANLMGGGPIPLP